MASISEISTEKPIINMDFIRKSLKQAKYPNLETLSGVDIDEFIFSSIRLVADAVQDCIAFVHMRHDDPHYLKIAEVLRQRHQALPKNDPRKLNDKQINEEVLRYQLKELSAKAIENGAALLVYKEQIEDYPCIIVPNLKDAFLHLCECYTRQFDTSIVQVTGSFGKTSACQMVYDMLIANEKNVHRNKLNGNDYPGVVNALARLTRRHEFYVQETQEAPIAWTASAMSKVLRPKVGIITNAGDSHLQVMKTRANVIHACIGIQDGIPKDGLLVVNGDDSALKKRLRKSKAPIVYFGIENKDSDCLGTNIRLTQSGTNFDLVYQGQSTPIHIASLGEHNVYNAMSAFLTGKHLGLTEDEIVKGIAAHKSQGIRQNLVNIDGRILYIDCYNASVETTNAAIQIISDTAIETSGGKRIAILGSIAELGKENLNGHTKVGQAVAHSNIDTLICYGHNAQIIADAAKEKPGLKIIKTMDRNHLVQVIKAETNPGDLILVKGSRSAYLEMALDFAFGTYFTLESEEQFVEAPVIQYGNFIADCYKEHTTVTQYIGSKSEIPIPDVFYWKEGQQGKYNIFGIGACVFQGKDFITTVYLPSTLRTIKKQAFADCPNLSQIYIPPAAVNISPDAFTNSPVTIYGRPASYAESYAKAHDIPFKEYFGYENPDFEFVSVPIPDIDIADDLALVNHENPIETIPDLESFALADLIVPTIKEKTVYTKDIALVHAQQFLKAAKDDGLRLLALADGFRDFNRQSNHTAQPHHSEHHTGLALDIVIKGLDQQSMTTTPEAQWLASNAYRYGFILRYPKGKEDITNIHYKPWHFRYVGKIHAYYMWANNLVLEEYLDLLKTQGKLAIDMYDSHYYVFYQQSDETNDLPIPKGFKCSVSEDNRGGYIIMADLQDRI